MLQVQLVISRGYAVTMKIGSYILSSGMQWALGATTTWAMLGCSGDVGVEADRLGVAAECDQDADCPIVEIDGEEVQLTCLTQFKDGYCAIEGCQSNADCPEAASCVAHTDQTNYCFRQCREKFECNYNRSADSEANCSSNFDYADPADDASGVKACIPPSG